MEKYHLIAIHYCAFQMRYEHACSLLFKLICEMCSSDVINSIINSNQSIAIKNEKKILRLFPVLWIDSNQNINWALIINIKLNCICVCDDSESFFCSNREQIHFFRVRLNDNVLIFQCSKFYWCLKFYIISRLISPLTFSIVIWYWQIQRIFAAVLLQAINQYSILLICVQRNPCEWFLSNRNNELWLVPCPKDDGKKTISTNTLVHQISVCSENIHISYCDAVIKFLLDVAYMNEMSP